MFPLLKAMIHGTVVSMQNTYPMLFSASCHFICSLTVSLQQAATVQSHLQGLEPGVAFLQRRFATRGARPLPFLELTDPLSTGLFVGRLALHAGECKREPASSEDLILFHCNEQRPCICPGLVLTSSAGMMFGRTCDSAMLKIWTLDLKQTHKSLE
jgi:hypothetical protein